MIRAEKNRLIYCHDTEQLWIEPWGSGIRVRGSKGTPIDPDCLWALTGEGEGAGEGGVIIRQESSGAYWELIYGAITARLDQYGTLSFLRGNTVLLQEYRRTVEEFDREPCIPLGVVSREYKPVLGTDSYGLTVRFEPNDGEKLYGMGQYQEGLLDLKGAALELAQRNCQASVPFLVSSRGYGFLWNNPGIGRVTFATNLTEWHLENSGQLDYWICTGEAPREILEQYAQVTGTPPAFPQFATGFWQCKLRYQTQEEVLQVAREYHRRGLPLSAIVIDFFHWTNQGEWKFDPEYWPDPKAMVEELEAMGVKTIVSVWPTVDEHSENYEEMKDLGYLVQTDRGVRTQMTFCGNETIFDATNPQARRYVWEKVKANYFDLGIRQFWLDVAEPEYAIQDFDNYRYHMGPNLKVGNSFPMWYAKGFYDGLKEAGEKEIVNLTRCAWAGSQRYGVLAWSGDVYSSFGTLRRQIPAGLNMGMAGIPWWTTDVGGFRGGNIEDPHFQECLIRWFQFAVFTPVLRLHGTRMPDKAPLSDKVGGGMCASGADNELWSYGEGVYAVLRDYLLLREALRPYVSRLMHKAHETGAPLMRPLFYEFPEDEKAWNYEDSYLFGPQLLVAPILEENSRSRTVYLPYGAQWTDIWSETVYSGGQTVEVQADIQRIPVFIRDDSPLKDVFHQWKLQTQPD